VYDFLFKVIVNKIGLDSMAQRRSLHRHRQVVDFSFYRKRIQEVGLGKFKKRRAIFIKRYGYE
jgi:hypothetical protein